MSGPGSSALSYLGIRVLVGGSDAGARGRSPASQLSRSHHAPSLILWLGLLIRSGKCTEALEVPDQSMLLVPGGFQLHVDEGHLGYHCFGNGSSLGQVRVG